MPEFPALDEFPAADGADTPLGDNVQCPECDKSFKPTGIKRHITMAHRGGMPDSSGSSTSKGGSKARINIETRWADFQRGAAMLVSLACSDCATALAEDAENDGKALAQFCEHKPKLRKQVEDFLSTADFLLLVGAFGGTAQKMLSHHSIGKRIPGISPTTNHHDPSHDPASRMMQFMGSMPPEKRHLMMDQVFAAQQEAAAKQQQEATAMQQQEAVAPIVDPGIGTEPQPDTSGLTEHDLMIREAMTQGEQAFSETVGSLA